MTSIETSHTKQRCDDCGNELGALEIITQCPRCGGLLALEYKAPAERGKKLRARFDGRRAAALGYDPVAGDAIPLDASGVWRYRELVLPDAKASDVVTHPEGNTPLLQRAFASKWTGVNALLLKHEGANPTGSFKDRGMTVAVTQARRVGASAVACASTGNTAASLASYAAHAGLPALVLVPSGHVSLGKLAQSLAYGARTLLVRGDFDDCMRLAREAAEHLGVYLANSINPYRIAGQKTIVIELLQQLSWRAPDWITLPAGNLGNTSAFGAALENAFNLGLIEKMPRIAAVQASGAAPFAASYRDDFRTRHTMRAETVATAIRIGDPASYSRAVRVIRETNGVVLDVSDAAILEAKAIVDASGVGCEPASAASVAGVRELVRRGVIRPDEVVVAVLTGHILKDPGILLQYHRETEPAPTHANRPIEIDAQLSAVQRVLQSAH
ncbi:MAG TPA: threonine synthase [Gemmatimonadaceae bacterium]|jgi:threonine synthase